MNEIAVGVLSALIAGVVAWYGVERQLAVRAVTDERAKWRDRVRALAMDLTTGGDDPREVRARAAMGLRLSLNPYDRLDREIVALLDRMTGSADPARADLEALAMRLQLLLKHDWERAKREASWPLRAADAFRRTLRLEARPRKPSSVRFNIWRGRHPIDLDDLAEN